MNYITDSVRDKEWEPFGMFEDNLKCPNGFDCINDTCYPSDYITYAKYLKK